jgi:DNA polymerase V
MAASVGPVFAAAECTVGSARVSVSAVTPKIRKCPVIVLSNNDGCAVARTAEAKALGICMGEPFFKIRDLCRHQRVAVYSSNYTLYDDMSRRMNEVHRQFSPDVEIY